MAYDGNGNWIPEFSAKEDKDAGVKILASRFDDVFQQDLKESFEKCLTKDGQSRPVSDFNFNNHKGINVADPVYENDAVNKKYLDENAIFKTGNQAIDGELEVSTIESVDDVSKKVATTEWMRNSVLGGGVLGYPDYSNTKTLKNNQNTSGYTYAAEGNGYILINTHQGGTGPSGNERAFYGEIGNMPITLGGYFANYHESDSFFFPVKKGDVLSCSSGFCSIYFIPVR